jgi:hypothetical protein
MISVELALAHDARRPAYPKEAFLHSSMAHNGRKRRDVCGEVENYENLTRLLDQCTSALQRNGKRKLFKQDRVVSRRRVHNHSLQLAGSTAQPYYSGHDCNGTK